MQDIQDSETVGEYSTPLPIGKTYFSRHLDVVRTGVLETEIELLTLNQSETSNPQPHTNHYHLTGRAIISTAFSKTWEANLELIQAKTPDRMLNMQIFAALLRCIRRICAERFIAHLAVVDIEHPSQNWYRDFFRLSGFHRCRCVSASSDGRAVQLEPRRRCLRLRNAPLGDFPDPYDSIRSWLAEGRCTRALLESVAFGEAAEVERRYFHRLLAGLEKGKAGQSTQVDTACVGRDDTQSQRSEQGSEKTRAMPRTKVLKLGSEAVSSGKNRSSDYAVVKRVGGSRRSKPGKSKHGVRKAGEVFGVRKRHRLSNSGRRVDEVFTE